MRTGIRFWLIIPILLVVGLATLFVMRARGGEETGPPVALCPGPDQYGYTCVPGADFDYIDATNDTELYSDDGLIELELPFDFTFYGRVYDVIRVSSNGNIQFTGESAAFSNRCLTDAPAEGMGDMIAPYWDDLNLTLQGFLETEIVGSSPQRTYVIEWDSVPSFSDPNDMVTFEVQLFEGSNDIVFLYEDATRVQGNSGSSATIGLQSEEQGLAIQYGCNQFAVSDGSVVHFLHPAETVETALAVGSSAEADSSDPFTSSPAAKGSVGLLVAALNRRGPSALPEMRAHWLSRVPKKDSQWLWADVDGDVDDELVFLWRAAQPLSHLSQLAILGRSDEGQWQQLWDVWPLARQEDLRDVVLKEAADLTGDGQADLVLQDGSGDRLVVVTRATGDYGIEAVPGRCTGGLVLRDVVGDGALEIVRDGCKDPGRTIATWDGEGFVIK